MRRYSTFLAIVILGLIIFLSLPSSAAKSRPTGISSFAKVCANSRRHPVGTETCTTCHADLARDFRHAFHAQQGVLIAKRVMVPGSLHVQGGGDISKIISFRKRSATGRERRSV